MTVAAPHPNGGYGVHPLRVGMLVGSASVSGGGVVEVVAALANALRIHGLRPEIFSLDQPGSQRRAFDGIPVHLASVKGPASFGYAPDLLRLLDEHPVDVLHVHGLWMYLSVAARQWAARSGRPYMVSPHGMLDPWALANSAWKKRLAWRLYEQAHLCSAAGLHALCEAEREAIDRLGLPVPVRVVPNGVEGVGAAVPVAPWRERLPHAARVLLFLGRVTPKKRVAELMRAWQRAAPSARQWHLAIVGPADTAYADELAAIVAAGGPVGRIHLLGPAYGDQRAAAYGSVDAFVLPSISEGLPMAVLEAFSHGLPALLTPQCNLPEAAGYGCALSMEADEASIEHALVRLFRMDAAERTLMGCNARRLVLEKFQWPNIAVRFTNIYSELVLGRRI